MTITTDIPTVATLDTELNRMIQEGNALEAFERFYAEDVVMQENSEPALAGKRSNREREIKFFDSVQTLHEARLLGAATKGDVSFTEWILDLTFKGGIRVKLEQVAVRRWRDGLVAAERFYYSPGH